MNRTIAGLSVLFFLIPAQVHPAQQTQQKQEHGRYDFPVTVNGQVHVLTYEGTHDVMKEPTRTATLPTPYTENGMYRGWVRGDGVIEVRIYER